LCFVQFVLKVGYCDNYYAKMAWVLIARNVTVRPDDLIRLSFGKSVLNRQLWRSALTK